MNNNPFETISYTLKQKSMTDSEKRHLRTTLAHYVTTHPVKSGLMSPYGFRAAFAIVATLVLVLGGSVGITSAASNALPNSKLYPIKLWVEEFQASQQKTPQAVIAYETTRINARFAEATELAVKHELNDQTSAIIETGLTHSQDLIKQSASQIATTNPELALAAANSVETAYSSNSKILSAIGKNTDQNLDTFILGAQISTESLAVDKTHYEQIVAMKPNTDTKSAAQLAFAKIQSELPSTPTTLSTDSTPSTSGGQAADETSTAQVTPIMMMAKIAAPIKPLPNPLLQGEGAATPTPTTSDLVAQAKAKMDAGLYSDALVILQKAQQMIDESNLTQTLETTYKVTADSIPAASIDTTSTQTAVVAPVAPITPDQSSTDATSSTSLVKSIQLKASSNNTDSTGQ